MQGAGIQLALDFVGAGPEGLQPVRRVRREAAVRLVEFAPFPRVSSDQRWQRGSTVDLSDAGACLRAEEAVPVGSLLHVIVRSVDGRPSLDAVARVAWCATGPERGARIRLDLVAVRERRPRPVRRPAPGWARLARA